VGPAIAMGAFVFGWSIIMYMLGWYCRGKWELSLDEDDK